MKNTITLKKISVFVLFLTAITFLKQLSISYLIEHYAIDYTNTLLVKIIFNIVLTAVSFYFIKTSNLLKPAGLTNIKPNKTKFVIIGSAYLILLNLLFADDIVNATFLNILLLLVYCLSVGFAEEMSIRGFLQSALSNFFSNQKKAIVIASLIFGVLHLIRFDKGIYGELSQILFATFIGIMFGAILVITKRIYPLIIAHALIDFAGGIDALGKSLSLKSIEPTSLTSALVIVVLVSPCLFYGLFLMKKHIKNE